MKTVCCVCHKTKSQNGWGWVKQNISQTRKLSHGYCPDCYRQTLQKIEGTSFQGNARNNGRALNLK